MEFNIVPDNEALSKCPCCQSEITEFMEVFGLGAKLNPDVDMSEYQGHCIEIELASEDMSVYMMVTGQGSEAKNEGKDAMFLVCSEKCAKKLKNVLEKEISLGEMFKTVVND